MEVVAARRWVSTIDAMELGGGCPSSGDGTNGMEGSDASQRTRRRIALA